MSTTSSAMPIDDGQPRRCVECGAPVSAPYCEACGAETNPSRLTFRSILATTIEHFLSFEMPLMRTAADLLRRPGRVAAEYLQGKRRSYANPLKFSLITGTIIVAVVHLALDTTPPDYSVLDRLDATADGRLFKQSVLLSNRWHNEYLHIIYFLALPILAFYMRLLFIKREPRIFDWYVLCLYVHGIVYLIQAVCISLMVWVTRESWPTVVIGTVSGLSPFVWFCWGAAQFTTRSRWLSIPLALVAYIAFSISIWIMLIGSAAAYVWMNDLHVAS